MYEDEWMDMVNYLYSTADSARVNHILRTMATELRDPSAPISLSVMGGSGTFGTNKMYSNKTEGTFGYDRNSMKDRKRLGYNSPSLKIQAVVGNPVKSRQGVLQMPFAMFTKLILDFQMHTHQDYLKQFLAIFQQYDNDADGVINAAEFKEVYTAFRVVILIEKKIESDKREQERLNGSLVITTANMKNGNGSGSGIDYGITSITHNKTPNRRKSVAAAPQHIHITSNPSLHCQPEIIPTPRMKDTHDYSSDNEELRQLDEKDFKLFLEVLQQVDPQQSDRIIFSRAVICVRKLNLHLMGSSDEGEG